MPWEGWKCESPRRNGISVSSQVEARGGRRTAIGRGFGVGSSHDIGEVQKIFENADKIENEKYPEKYLI